MQYLPIGTIITGTTRERDVLEALADTLERIERANGCDTYAGIVRDARLAIEHLDTIEGAMGSDDAESIHETIDQLCDSLDMYAPRFTWIGTLPGDGADIGVWVDPEMVDEAVADDEIAKIDDASELDDVPHDVAVVVNDHGNMTCYAKHSDGWRELWSVV